MEAACTESRRWIRCILEALVAKAAQKGTWPLGIIKASDRGGGIIELTAQNIRNNGSIECNGKSGRHRGAWVSAGSGGSIKIKCKTFENAGSIKALGGRAPRGPMVNQKDTEYEPVHGDGGMGRIAIFADEIDGAATKKRIRPEPYCAETIEWRSGGGLMSPVLSNLSMSMKHPGYAHCGGPDQQPIELIFHGAFLDPECRNAEDKSDGNSFQDAAEEEYDSDVEDEFIAARQICSGPLLRMFDTKDAVAVHGTMDQYSIPKMHTPTSHGMMDVPDRDPFVEAQSVWRSRRRAVRI